MKRKMIMAACLLSAALLLCPITAAAKESTSYTVKKGDTLWRIAYDFLGDGRLYTDIFQQNNNILLKPELIFPGQQITIASKTPQDDEPLSEGTFLISGDEYQQCNMYIGTKYTIKKKDRIHDYIVTAASDVATIEDNKTVTPHKIGAGFLWVLDEKGDIASCFSIGFIGDESASVWSDDEHLVFESYKKIKEVKSSDEDIATPSFKNKEIYAQGKNVGECSFIVFYDDGSHESFKVYCIGSLEKTYDECEEMAKKYKKYKR